jgi:lysozyme family protein
MVNAHPENSSFSPSARLGQFFNRLIREEGGLVDDPADSGGLTKYGISQASYPNVNIKALTQADAALIYQHDFYNPLQCDNINDAHLSYALFDMGVNCGVKRAAMTFQVAVNAIGNDLVVDGDIGIKTITAVNNCNQALLLFIFCSLRLNYYLDIVKKSPKNSKFFIGWAKRTRRCLLGEI